MLQNISLSHCAAIASCMHFLHGLITIDSNQEIKQGFQRLPQQHLSIFTWENSYKTYKENKIRVSSLKCRIKIVLIHFPTFDLILAFPKIFDFVFFGCIFISHSHHLIRAIMVICIIGHIDRNKKTIMTYMTFYDFKLPIAYSKCDFNTWLEWYVRGGCGIGWCGMPFWNTFLCMPFAAVAPPRKFCIIDTILFWRATVPPNSCMTSFSMMDSIYKCGKRGAVNGGYMNK